MAKRIFDLIGSMIGILLLLPVFTVIALFIKLDSRGPVFFCQKRVGKNGKPFMIIKFRTMVTEAPQIGRAITVGQDPRITKTGVFIRKYKLDELPQLFNVFKGEMSFVGPRPEVPKYVAFYDEDQKKVLSVKPGITDLASIEYRNESDLLAESPDPEQTYINEIMPRKIELNVQYIDNKSVIYDIKIIIQTIRAVLFD